MRNLSLLHFQEHLQDQDHLQDLLLLLLGSLRWIV